MNCWSRRQNCKVIMLPALTDINWAILLIEAPPRSRTGGVKLGIYSRPPSSANTSCEAQDVCEPACCCLAVSLLSALERSRAAAVEERLRDVWELLMLLQAAKDV
jgi:hypothetical protein